MVISKLLWYLLLLVNMEFLNSFITLIGLHVILGLFTAVSKRMRYVTTYAITQYIIAACIVPLLFQSKYKLLADHIDHRLHPSCNFPCDVQSADT